MSSIQSRGQFPVQGGLYQSHLGMVTQERTALHLACTQSTWSSCTSTLTRLERRHLILKLSVSTSNDLHNGHETSATMSCTMPHGNSH